MPSQTPYLYLTNEGAITAKYFTRKLLSNHVLLIMSRDSGHMTEEV